MIILSIFIPKIFSPIPMLPDVPGDVPVLENIREGIQYLLIDTTFLSDEEIETYMINITVPDMKVPFINPVAAHFVVLLLKLKDLVI